jgi:putative ABC transport system permease protein
MGHSIYQISFLNLLWIFIPVFVVIVIFYRWSLGVSTVFHGLLRMCLQLILVGYVLNFIFDAQQPLIIIGVLCIMLAAAGVISLRPLRKKTGKLLLKAFLSISISGTLTLLIFHELGKPRGRTAGI